MKRTFIAVKIEAGENLKKMIADIRKELQNDSIKWVDIGNMHITIAFLGDTTEESVEQVSKMLLKRCSGTGGFTFTLSSLGIFKNINDPRVIWTGIENSEKLISLNDIVKKGVEEIGIKTEERAFNPHLTLGRIRMIKEKKLLEDLLAKYKSTSFQEVHISEVIFFESILSQTGPAYKSIFSIRL
jgi:2'-5' RNA ligase